LELQLLLNFLFSKDCLTSPPVAWSTWEVSASSIPPSTETSVEDGSGFEAVQ
jgi:hypothetical protein